LLNYNQEFNKSPKLHIMALPIANYYS